MEISCIFEKIKILKYGRGLWEGLKYVKNIFSYEFNVILKG